jgi:hypothetical protein
VGHVIFSTHMVMEVRVDMVNIVDMVVMADSVVKADQMLTKFFVYQFICLPKLVVIFDRIFSLSSKQTMFWSKATKPSGGARVLAGSSENLV